MLPYLTKVRSVWSGSFNRIGVIVGYGTIQWPSGPNISGDDGIPQPVYLIQLDDCEGSSYGRSVSAIFRADRVEEVS